MAIRKDANTLTSSERNEFVSAVLELKARGIYDRFVLRHANAVMTAIHRCPAFLPWHRRFLWDLERELQQVSGNPNLGIPYWNWPEGGENASMWDNDTSSAATVKQAQVPSSMARFAVTNGRSLVGTASLLARSDANSAREPQPCLPKTTSILFWHKRLTTHSPGMPTRRMVYEI